MYDTDWAEKRQEKKIKRLLKKSAWAIGIGFGLFLLKIVIVPFLGSNEDVEKALLIFSLCLIAYGGILVLSFMFLRTMLSKIDLALSWVIMPAFLVKILMDVLK